MKKSMMLIPSSFHRNNHTLLIRVPPDIAKAIGKARGDRCKIEMVSEKELRVLME